MSNSLTEATTLPISPLKPDVPRQHIRSYLLQLEL